MGLYDRPSVTLFNRFVLSETYLTYEFHVLSEICFSWFMIIHFFWFTGASNHLQRIGATISVRGEKKIVTFFQQEGRNIWFNLFLWKLYWSGEFYHLTKGIADDLKNVQTEKNNSFPVKSQSSTKWLTRFVILSSTTFWKLSTKYFLNQSVYHIQLNGLSWFL